MASRKPLIDETARSERSHPRTLPASTLSALPVRTKVLLNFAGAGRKIAQKFHPIRLSPDVAAGCALPARWQAARMGLQVMGQLASSDIRK